MTDRALLQQALEALENLQGLCTDAQDGWVEAVTIWTPEIIAALRERLAQPEQCRTDGRCQYAIDHGAEGLGHCPPGKCCMPARLEPNAQEVQNAAENLALMKRMFPQPDTKVNLEAIPKQVLEPVAWADMDVRGEDKGLSWTPGHFHKTPLYTTPPQRKHNNGVIAERQRIVNLLMIQHEAAKGAHNYWHVAAQLIQADVASDT